MLYGRHMFGKSTKVASIANEEHMVVILNSSMDYRFLVATKTKEDIEFGRL